MADYNDFVKTKFVCSCCNEPLPLKEFFKANSRFYSNAGHFGTCKKCMAALFQEYTVEYGCRMKAMQRFCMAFDIYYNAELFMSCDDGTPTVLGNYVKKMNLVNYRNRTFDTTLEDGFYFSINGEEEKEEEKDKKGKPLVPPEIVKKWGKNLSIDDYDVLEDHYKLLKGANPNLNDNQEIYINELCYTKMFQMRALRNGDTDQFGKMSDNYRKTFTQAGLKAVREIESDSNDCWGEWVRRIEEYTPAEYYKNKSLFNDFDNVGEYFERFVLRPLRNLMHGTSDRDYEFSVEDTEDGDEE